MVPRVVIDTNVLVAGLRSRNGASFELLRRLGTGQFQPVVSVPLVLQYEEVLLREPRLTPLSDAQVNAVLDYLSQVSHRQTVFYLWRPLLPDSLDDMVLELAVAAQCAAIVTHNTRDFAGARTFQLEVLAPREFLARLGGAP